MNASAPPSPKAALSLSKRSQAVSAVTAPMGDPNLHTHSDPAARLQVVPDQLTGLETVPLDAVTPVRVEVLAREGDPMRNQGSEPSPTLEALRRSIEAAEQRLGSERALRQQLEASQEQLRLQQEQLQVLQRERDSLRIELDLAQRQLAEVDVLQRQLQQLLERNL